MVLHHSKAESDNERMLSALGGEGRRVVQIYYGTFSKLSSGFSSRMAVTLVSTFFSARVVLLFGGAAGIEPAAFELLRDLNAQKCTPAKCRGTSLVEAAGQLFLIFRKGLDYTFILLPGCGACYSRLNNALNPSIGSSQ